MMNDAMADLASDALNSMRYFVNHIDGDAGADTVWVSGHGLSGLTEFSHCVLRLLAGFPHKMFSRKI
jgi:hypothetical protein